ncbi:hypothetical protein [Desulfocurvus sp.]|uniref:hypothetical protein n=1 Tax=Desulfocurvus sp. TaxID=2871698 RepID=UPI0025BD0801|nr:hypothetical protein [Desulfocurvus sp.]MCK9241596.1 hypothetical protein [Desulfocurvus sp.]
MPNSLFSLTVLAQAAGRTGWEGWPFGGSGPGGVVLASAARIVFILAVFALLAWALRRLFGPGGPLRPREFGTGHIGERRRRAAARRELHASWRAGRMTDEDYAAARKALDED